MQSPYIAPITKVSEISPSCLLVSSITPKGSAHSLYIDSSATADEETEARVKTTTIEWESWK